MSNEKFDPHFDLVSQPGVSTLVDGIELLSALFHPENIYGASSLKNRFENIATTYKMVTH